MNQKYVFEYLELPSNIRTKLVDYYDNTDQRAILNDSYTRFPYLFDWDPVNEEQLNGLDEWFINSGVPIEEGSIIIHWDW